MIYIARSTNINVITVNIGYFTIQLISVDEFDITMDDLPLPPSPQKKAKKKDKKTKTKSLHKFLEAVYRGITFLGVINYDIN